MNTKTIIFLFVSAYLLLLTGCEIPNTRKNIRSPHMPVFSQITPNEESLSNPYWVRFTGIYDDPQIDLSDGYEFKPDRPTFIGTLGTHYRLPSNYYGYVMTDGLGVQYDAKFWEQSKFGVGAFLGINNTWGIQALWATKLGTIYNGDVTFYTSLQRRGGTHLISCEKLQGIECRGEAPTSRNTVRTKHEAIDFIIGTELGRFKLGQVGNTTLNFKVEIGYNHILNNEITYESAPSNFSQNLENMTISIHSGLTLW